MTLLLQILGFAALAAAMHATPRPWRLRDGGRPRRVSRVAGVALLAASMLTTGESDIGLAIVDWLGLATVSALLVTLAVTAARLRPGGMKR